MRPTDDAWTEVKQYTAVAAAGTGVGAVPAVNLVAVNPLRNYFYIENVGMNAGTFWWDDQVNSGQAISLGPTQAREYATKCPIQRLYIASLLGTSFAIIEGMDLRRRGNG